MTRAPESRVSEFLTVTGGELAPRASETVQTPVEPQDGGGRSVWDWLFSPKRSAKEAAIEAASGAALYVGVVIIALMLVAFGLYLITRDLLPSPAAVAAAVKG